MLLYRVVVLRIKDSGGKQTTFAHIPRETSGHSGRARTADNGEWGTIDNPLFRDQLLSLKNSITVSEQRTEPTNIKQN